MKMKTTARLALAVACVAVLTAASWPTQLPALSTTAAPRAYTLVDQRDPKKLKSGFESLALWNCAYGSLRIGDNDIDPHLVPVLDNALAARFGDRLAGRTLTLQAFVVHLNKSVGMRQSVSDMYGGLVEGAINKKKVGCEPEDLIGGYTMGEVQPGMLPVVVAIQLEIDGHQFVGRAVTESPAPIPARQRDKPEVKAAWNAAVAKTVNGALANLGDKIEQGMFTAAASVAPASTASVAPAAATQTPAAAGASD
jgi:hypothetical protein